MIIKLNGNEDGPISLKKVLETKYSGDLWNADIGLEDVVKLMVEERKLLTLTEAKMIFDYAL